MNQDELVFLGDYAESLMRNTTFNRLCALFRENAFNSMIGTNADEAKKREGIYADVWGLQSFLGHMKSYVEARDNINKPSNPDEPEE